MIQNARKLDEWFEWECRVGRRNVRRLLKKYRRSLLDDERSAFCLARKRIQTLTEEKEKDFYNILLDKLISSVKNQKDFGNLYIRCHPKQSPPVIIFLWIVALNILERYLKKEVDFDFDDENAVQDSESFLSRPVSKEEVMLAFRKLKNEKAAGPDGITGEMLKNSANHEFFQLNGLNLSYERRSLRKARLIIRIITEVSRYVTQAAKFTVQLLTLDCKNGLK